MKKSLCAVFAVLLALMLTGCNNASGITESTTQPTKPVATTPVQTTPAPTTPPTTPAPTEPTTAEPTTAPVEQLDEWEMFRWGKDYAEKSGGIYLKKDFLRYFISKAYISAYDFGTGFIPGKRTMIYNVGVCQENMVRLYEHQYYSSKLAGIISYGNVPVIFVDGKNDMVVGYFSSDPLIMRLKKVVSYGYSLPIMTNTTNTISIEQNSNGIPFVIRGDISKMSITDKDGNTPEDFRNLTFGESYTVSWYEGTKYNEVSMVADCSYYTHLEKNELIELQGVLTKDGYCTFDFSNVEPGFYETQGGLIIKVAE